MTFLVAQQAPGPSVLHANYNPYMVNNDQERASASDIRSVARVGQICALFGPRVVELTAAEVAERTGLNRTTAYRYCASMVAAGILQPGSRRGTFALGALMLELGLGALGRERVLEVARPYLRELSTAVGMTAVLSIPGTHGPVVALVAEETDRQVLVTVRVGTTLDASAAQSRVFLAFGDDPSLRVLTEGLSPADRARLDADVAKVRRHGYSVVRPKNLPFVAAAPVFDETRLRATVAFLGVGDADLAPAIEELRRTAGEIGGALGAQAEAGP
ncbi:transcriptional regulator [Streptomyces sp. WAC 01420]|nr:transcriptional regulator [Streptomyces sp. WAC 01438]RSM98976.1 transcriptional regulator [Streptomyces sp. WAC 01420]